MSAVKTKYHVTLAKCEKIIDKALSKGAEVIELEEGVLGLGITLIGYHGSKKDKWKVITEKYVSAWVSDHTIEKYHGYNTLPENIRKKFEEIAWG